MIWKNDEASGKKQTNNQTQGDCPFFSHTNITHDFALSVGQTVSVSSVCEWEQTGVTTD